MSQHSAEVMRFLGCKQVLKSQRIFISPSSLAFLAPRSLYVPLEPQNACSTAISVISVPWSAREAKVPLAPLSGRERWGVDPFGTAQFKVEHEDACCSGVLQLRVGRAAGPSGVCPAPPRRREGMAHARGRILWGGVERREREYLTPSRPRRFSARSVHAPTDRPSLAQAP